VHFGRDTKSQILAEGVETAAELESLRKLGVESAQGYFLGRPMPYLEARTLIQKLSLVEGPFPKVVPLTA
jgi:EAL domain-containing protein (putative c-di-GMP-specific phosphodiesterase class I)